MTNDFTVVRTARLAVVTADRVRVFEGRRFLAEFAVEGPITDELINEAKWAANEPMPEPEQPRRPVVGFFTPSWGRLQ